MKNCKIKQHQPSCGWRNIKEKMYFKKLSLDGIMLHDSVVIPNSCQNSPKNFLFVFFYN